MIVTLFLACAPWLPNDTETADSVLVRYDLSSTLPTFDDAQIDESLLIRGGASEGYLEIRRTNLDDLYGSEGADKIVDLVTRLHGEEFEYEGREIVMQGDDEMLVLAPADLQQKVKATLAEFERVLSSNVRLQVDVVDLPGEGPAPFGGATVIDAGQLANLPSGQGNSHETYTVRLFAGRTSVVHNMRSIPVLTDYDVEIAQGASIHDPVVSAVETGTRMLLRGAPVKGGVALSMFYLHGDALQEDPVMVNAQLRSFISQEKGESYLVEAPSMQERMEIAFRSAAINTVLPDGKALVLNSHMDIAGTSSRQAVIIRRVDGDLPRFTRFSPAGTSRELVFINAETMHVPELGTWGKFESTQENEGGAVPRFYAKLTAEPSIFLMDWVGKRFSTWRSVGPWLLCVYDPTWDEDAADKAAALIEAWSGGSDLVQLSLGVRSQGHGGSKPASWVLPVRAGAPSAGLLGITSTSLVDYDVEVAQFVAAPDPTHQPTFNGFSFHANPSRTSAGGVTIDLDAIAQLRHGDMRSLSTGGPYITKIEQSRYDTLRVGERIAMPSGMPAGWAVLGDHGENGPLGIEVGVK